MLYRGIPRHLLLAIRNDEVTSNGLPLLELPLLNKVFELPLSIALGSVAQHPSRFLA
jgi:hypothetical protein